MASHLPHNYVAPAQYYTLGTVDGVNGGNLEQPARPPLTTTISQRVVGSRFQEVRTSADAGQLLGEAVHVDDAGQLRAGPGPRARTFSLLQGPNHPDQPSPAIPEAEEPISSPDDAYASPAALSWVEPGPSSQGGIRWPTAGAPPATGGPSEFGVRIRDDAPKRSRMQEASAATRSTFPMRAKAAPGTLDPAGEAVAPPHLRLQPQQPFVRPRSGLDHEHLGVIYADIGVWRSRLKQINAEIAETQQAGYSDIAEGSGRVKGYLIVGRGVRFIKGVRMIEGRSKDDVRWDELQRNGGLKGDLAFIGLVILIALALALAGAFSLF